MRFPGIIIAALFVTTATLGCGMEPDTDPTTQEFDAGVDAIGDGELDASTDDGELDAHGNENGDAGIDTGDDEDANGTDDRDVGEAGNGDASDDASTNGDDTLERQLCLILCDVPSDCGEQEEWDCVDQTCHWNPEPDSPSTNNCTTDDDCIPLFSGWTESCANSDDCDDNQECIDFDGQGRCAFAEGDFIDCDALNMSAVDRALFDGTGTATICERQDGSCHEDGYCWFPCQSDDDCQSGFGDSCRPDGLCGCQSDDECDPEFSVDACIDGLCACSNDQVCQEGSACRSFSFP